MAEQREPEIPIINLDLLSPNEALGHEFEAGQRLVYEAAYAELCPLVTGKEPTDPPPDEEEFKQRVLEFLERNRDEWERRICSDLKYCEIRKKYGHFVTPVFFLFKLTALICDLCGLAGVATKGSMLASSFWLMSQKLLDKFCGCDHPS
tara:strand:- start:140 stop:586 length:447 start_codon:yes stop_codon:yes gene_type:complete